ncbi:hypothetical protein [Sphingobacterium deserti]|uniref:hypothetical protein n=1 Tax=Sphingobacterium deserti TaxID=1229276 RepID=UPI0005632519|nr:hypothetical protein [Sphingobacterium deserti]
MNEIGLGTDDISKTNTQLEESLGSYFWKGDLESFAANGSQEGLFVLPNYLTKETWFPSEVAIQPNPLERIIESGGKPYNFRFTDGNVEAFE